jgi:pyruvate,orthophosphate dikinase
MVRPETKPDDVHGMIAAKGILTSRGGATSHAAVVARQFGTPAVCGAEELEIDVDGASSGDHQDDKVIEVREGDWISIDGGTGEVFLGQLATQDPDFEHETELNHAAQVGRRSAQAGCVGQRRLSQGRRPRPPLRRPGHRPLPHRAHVLRGRAPAHRAGNDHGDQQGAPPGALERLLPVQRGDFEGIFRAMDGLPVIIRLLDPPLHEFLPSYHDLVADLADLKVRLQHFHTLSEIDTRPGQVRQKEDILNRVKALSESNPMLGLRGDRLSVVMPEITEMQVRAILEAAMHVKKEGIDVHPEIMVPLAGHVNELKFVKEIVDRIAAEVFAENGGDGGLQVWLDGRGAARGPDRRRTGHGGRVLQLRHQRPDADHLRHEPRRRRVQVPDGVHREGRAARPTPFQTVGPRRRRQADQDDRRTGPQTRPGMHMGICGEHGGDPNSIEFCHMAGLNYVSCSPYPRADRAARCSAGSHQTRVRE